MKQLSTINYVQAKQDVLPFVKDKSKLELWSEEFFDDITDSIIVAE